MTPGPSGRRNGRSRGRKSFYLTGQGVVGFVGFDLAAQEPGNASPSEPQRCATSPLVTNTFAPTFYDSMLAVVAFQLSGGTLSNATFEGSFTLDTVQAPEPSSALLLLGTAAAGAWRARRRRR